MSRRNSVRDRRECFERCRRTDHLGRIVLDCWICNGVILPAQEDWDCEHPTPVAFDGKGTLPAHPKCHDRKTYEKDIPEIAKGKRVRDQTFGVKRRKGFYRPPGVKFNWSSKRYEREKMEE